MNIAFCLFKFYPYGGLAQWMLGILKQCHEQGHHVTVFCLEWLGDRPDGLTIKLIDKKGMTNHTQARHFVTQVLPQLTPFDLVVGFNRMPGLDVYCAVDQCFSVKYDRHPLRRFFSRYRTWLALEKQTFAKQGKTLVLSQVNKLSQEIQHYYPHMHSRVRVLDPWVRFEGNIDSEDKQHAEHLRKLYLPTQNGFLLLLVGSHFYIKGVDRAIKALASLPLTLRKECHLLIVGKGRKSYYQCLAHALKVKSHVTFLSTKKQMVPYYLAANLLIHPAREEVAGSVLLEAMLYGLPVMATMVCGYADHIKKACAGKAMSEPFEQNDWNNQLRALLDHTQLTLFSKQTRNYVLPFTEPLFAKQAVNFFERYSHEKN